MKIEFLGHSCFLLTSGAGTRIITDPYAQENGIHYDAITEEADIVTVSHTHFDHGNVKAVRGNPQVVTDVKPVTIGDVSIRGIKTWHDDEMGKARGENTIYCFSIDGLKVCHLGDLGHNLTPAQAEEIGKVDVMMVPVGGFFTIDAPTALRIVEQVQPAIAIPMHFRNEKCDFPITEVSDFTEGIENVVHVHSSGLEITAKELPQTTQVMVFEPKK